MSRRAVFVLNGLILLGMLAALALAGFGWRALDETPGFGRVVVGLGLAGAIAAAVLLFLPVAVRINMVLLGTSTVLTLLIASWLLHEPHTQVEIHDRRAEAARAAGLDFDTRHTRHALDDLWDDGIDAFPPLSAWALMDDDDEQALAAVAGRSILPLAGVSHATTVLCNESGEFLILETDRFGFNNADRAYEASAPVLVMGDSYAFGYCVAREDNVSGRLAAEGLELVNLGYPGTGPLIQLAQLREYGPRIQPRHILWLFYSNNDLENVVDEAEVPALMRYLDPEHSQDLAERQAEIDAFWRDYVHRHEVRRPERRDRSLREILTLTPLRDRLGLTRTALDQQLVSRFEPVLDAIVAEAERLGAPLHFVYLPHYNQFVGRSGEPHYEAVLAMVAARGIPITDFTETLLASGDPLQYYPFRLQGHFNEAGYALLAEQILEDVPELREALEPPRLTEAIDDEERPSRLGELRRPYGDFERASRRSGAHN